MSILRSPNINYCWAALLIEELGRCGVEAAFISPGSRSSPLALSLACSEKIKTFVHFDERGTGFAALGFSAANRTPTLVVTTSGTAVANLFPAVVEASKKKLPLIILTADRPPEFRSTGAHQTIDQVGIFGKYVQWHTDIPCPTTDIVPSYILTTADQAVYRASSGPVHLNCMFREPLAPVSDNNNIHSYLKPLSAWLKSNRPFTKYHSNSISLSEPSTQELAKIVNASKRGIIVAGKLGDGPDQEAALKLAQKLSWPIFADIASGLRLGTKNTHVIHFFDQLLRSDALAEQIAPDCVLHLGGRITSKNWYHFVAKTKPEHYIMVLNHPLRNDPLHNVTERVQANIGGFITNLMPRLKQKGDTATLNYLRKANTKVNELLQNELEHSAYLTEAAVARRISELIPEDSALFLSNSLPIREMELFAAVDGARIRVEGNRGASGIDGIIATATGFSLGLNQRVTLLIGDLAALHDLNSLDLLRQLKHPLNIVVLNNDGGGIFSFLPVADDKTAEANFEKFFETPHGLNFQNAAKMFNMVYAAPKSLSEFSNIFKQSRLSKKSLLIEINTTKSDNVKLSKQFGVQLKKLLR